MSPEKRQKVLAGVLVGLLGLVGLRTLLPALRSGGSGGVEVFSRRGSAGSLSLPELETLKLDALANKPGEFTIGRDPFRFAQAPKPPPPPAPPPQPRPQRRNNTPPPAPRPQGPKPPPVDVAYLGSFGPDRGRIAVFTDGVDLYNARVGDVVKTHFRVESIGYESADLKFVNFPDVPAQRLEAGG